MRIALLTNGIWPFVVGGMQKHSYFLCKYLARNGVTVDLYHSSGNGTKPDLAAIYTEQEREYINDYYLAYPAGKDRLPGHYLRTSYLFSKMIYEMMIRHNMPDIIYAKGLGSWHTLKEKKTGTELPPVCINVHGYEYYQKAATLRGRLEQWMLRPAFRYVNTHADYIYSYGPPVSDIIRKHIPDSANKIIEIPAGIERVAVSSAPSPVNRPRQFVFAGRFERRKGIEELHAAIKRLEGSGDFRFHFIGDIPDSHKLKSDSCIYHGVLRDSVSVSAILRNADILVCPSYAEGMPNVVLEGMAAGCAIIASAAGAVPMMVDGNNGWLIKAGSVDAIEAAISNAMTIDPAALQDMKVNSLKKVRQDYLWENIIRQTIDSFHQILSGNKQRASRNFK